MITLYAFGPLLGLPDPSPFVVKAEMLLKMANVPYKKVVGDLRQSPKSKLPYIDDNGRIVSDSTLIRLYLADQHGIDLAKGLTAEQQALAWSVECLCSDHLYWCIIHERWMDDATFALGPAAFFKKIPALIRPIIVTMIRKKVRRNLEGQGLGRFTPEERQRLLMLDVRSLSDLLGDKLFMMGDQPCWLDATVFAFVSSGLTSALGKTPTYLALQACPNLVQYAQRIYQQYFDSAQLHA